MKELLYEEQPHQMNEPEIVAITGKGGYIHLLYKLRKAEVSATYSPAGGIGGNIIPFWEIYCPKLFGYVEQFATKEEMLKRLTHYNRKWWEFWK